MSFNPTAVRVHIPPPLDHQPLRCRGWNLQVPGYRLATPEGAQSDLVSKAESAYREAKAKVESQQPKQV